MIQDLALYTIEVELSELLALREQAMEEGEPPEAFACPHRGRDPGMRTKSGRSA